MAAIKYEDLSEAFEFVNAAPPMEHHAYISLDTGDICWISETLSLEETEVPGDLETSDRYVEVPHKNDLDLGRHLALRFTEEELPDQYGVVDGFFRRRGAYACFKGLLERKGRLNKWYAFEAECTERALKAWCEDNGIQLVDRETDCPDSESREA